MLSGVNKSNHADSAKLSPFLFQKAANFTEPVFEALEDEAGHSYCRAESDVG
ncbi:MAG: hypothetical protein H6975_04225 [Gammaproteobacteria bacterium]|nr:hypothetical protein [Gammaproteobacteria bacterium]